VATFKSTKGSGKLHVWPTSFTSVAIFGTFSDKNEYVHPSPSRTNAPAESPTNLWDTGCLGELNTTFFGVQYVHLYRHCKLSHHVDELYDYHDTTLCLKKRPTFTTCYNFYIHSSIATIFGTNVAEKVGNQNVLYFPTTPN